MARDLIDLFVDNKYKDALIENEIDISDSLSRIKNSVNEISYIFISNQFDELYFVIDARECEDPTKLCEKIDNKLCWFINFACSKKEVVHNLKYNLIQLLLYTQDNMKKTVENSLSVSRKIAIQCSYDGSCWKTDEFYKLPFYFPSPSQMQTNKQERKLFAKSLPSKEEYQFLYKDISKDNSFYIDKDMDKAIKRWLK